MANTELSLSRQKELENALLERMQTTPYSQITVTDLAKHVGIARKNFYYYFSGKEACLESITDRLIQDSALHVVRNLTDDLDPAKVYKESLRFWMAQKSYLDLVIKNNLVHIFLARTMRHIRQEEKLVQLLLGTPSMGFDEDILLFYVSGQLGLLLNWCVQGFPLSVEEMARKYLRLMHSPLLSWETGR